MHLKLYLDVKDLEKAYEFYYQIFDAEKIKEPQATVRHASLKIFKELTLLLRRRLDPDIEGTTNFVIKFEDNEVDKYLAAIDKVKTIDGIEITKDKIDGSWGTTIFEFKDSYGFIWDFEIKTEALKQP